MSTPYTTSSNVDILQIFRTITTETSYYDSSIKLPSVGQIVYRFLEYDDSELDVIDDIENDGLPYIIISDYDVVMHISQKDADVDMLHISLYYIGSTTPELTHIVNIEDILTNDDIFCVKVCQLISRFERFKSIFS